ncbi:MAG: AMP-binding protein, partial [Anaerolineales bacterium]|nr:AMP-binding protein [Anaerolineales bacterium]
MIHKSPYPDIEIPEVTVTAYTLRRAAELADKPALIDGPTGRTLTFKQLAGAIHMVAAGLQQRGFGKGDVMAILSPNIPEYAIAFHAVATVGGINTTINPTYNAEEIAYQLKDAGAKYLLTIPLFMEHAVAAAAEVGGIEEIFVFGEAEGATPFAALLQNNGQLQPTEIDVKNDLVVLPYSSGTTGLAKGVMLTHYNLVANMAQVVTMEALEDNDVLAGVLPFFHIYGMVLILNYALAEGATVVTMPRFDMVQFLELIQQHKITVAHLVPPIVLGLAKHPIVDKYDVSSLRSIISGAAPLGPELTAEAASRLGIIVKQGYGMTELSPVSHFMAGEESIRDGSVGYAIPNTETRVVDVATGEDLGPGQDGELWIRGPQVMQGYLNKPDATAETIVEDGWLRTGDIGHIDVDGYWFIVDRLKELIKYKGFQVPPAELEALLISHPSVSDVAVIPVPDEEAGEIPKAFVVRSGDASA